MKNTTTKTNPTNHNNSNSAVLAALSAAGHEYFDRAQGANPAATHYMERVNPFRTPALVASAYLLAAISSEGFRTPDEKAIKLIELGASKSKLTRVLSMGEDFGDAESVTHEEVKELLEAGVDEVNNFAQDKIDEKIGEMELIHTSTFTTDEEMEYVTSWFRTPDETIYLLKESESKRELGLPSKEVISKLKGSIKYILGDHNNLTVKSKKIADRKYDLYQMLIREDIASNKFRIAEIEEAMAIAGEPTPDNAFEIKLYNKRRNTLHELKAMNPTEDLLKEAAELATINEVWEEMTSMGTHLSKKKLKASRAEAEVLKGIHNDVKVQIANIIIPDHGQVNTEEAVRILCQTGAKTKDNDNWVELQMFSPEVELSEGKRKVTLCYNNDTMLISNIWLNSRERLTLKRA